MSVEDVTAEVARMAGPGKQIRNVLLTGGEPLLQRPTPTLARELTDQGFLVSIETHGEADFKPVRAAAPVRLILDIKTPASGMNKGREKWRLNLPGLLPGDEIKFVIASEEDYRWARALLFEDAELKTCLNRANPTILFSPAAPAPGQPGVFTGIEPRTLADFIVSDRLPVRLQLQLHKQLWGYARGV